MTRDRARPLGALGRRLLVAFVLVALTSVTVLTVAALVGTSRGLDADTASRRQASADAAARVAAAGYATAGGWAGADLAPAAAVAAAGGAGLTVLDATGNVVRSSPAAHASSGNGPGNGTGNGPGRGSMSADVVVDGVPVGAVRLSFGAPPSATGQAIAWTRILVSAAAALLIAFVAAAFTSRWLTAPIVRLSAVARAFARGDRSARPASDDLAAETELGDLARAFDAAADDVSRSERVRRRLSADVAHELRTPLTALQAGLEELREGLVPPTPEYLTPLHDQAVRLGRIVDDLAVLSSAESAALSLRREPLDLSALVAEAVAIARPTLASRGVAVSMTGPPSVQVIGDVDRLHQAVGNLLSNAGRYCRPGDAVHVTVGTTASHALVTVADDGPGIPAGDLPHVFERLWRGPGADGAGSGIGLTVVRELVEAHGGSIGVASDGSSGTTFTIGLPREPGPHQHDADVDVER